MELGSIRQIAKQQHPMLAAQGNEGIVRFPVVLAVFPFNATPREILPSPFHAGFLHRLEPLRKIGRARTKSSVDAKWRIGQQLGGKRMRWQSHLKIAVGLRLVASNDRAYGQTANADYYQQTTETVEL